MTYDPHTDWGASPTLAEFAAAVEAAKRGEHLPESDAWLEAAANDQPAARDDDACDRDERGRLIVHGGLNPTWRNR